MQYIGLNNSNNIGNNIQFADIDESITSLSEDFILPLDYRKWLINAPVKTLFTVGSAKIALSHGSSAYVSDFELKGQNKLIGNFSMQIDMSSIVGFSANNSKVCELYISNTSSYFLSLSKIKNALGFEYKFTYQNNLTTNSFSIQDDALSGKLKLIRIENRIIAYVFTSTNIWKQIADIELAGFSDNLSFQINSSSLSTNTGTVDISNFLLNNNTLALSESFIGAIALNTEKLNSHLSGTSTFSIISSVLNFSNSAASGDSYNYLVTPFGSSISDFDINTNFIDLTGIALNNILAELSTYNFYSANKNGLKIQYLSAATSPSNTLNFIRVDDNIETSIASITLDTAALFMRLTRVGDLYTAYYKLLEADTWISLGTYTSANYNNFKNTIIGSFKPSGNATITGKIRNLNSVIDKVEHPFKDSRIQNILSFPFNKLIKKNILNGGYSSNNGFNMNISNTATDINHVEYVGKLMGNFAITIELSDLIFPIETNAYFDIYLQSALNTLKEMKVRINKNQFGITAGKIWNIGNSTKDGGTVTHNLDIDIYNKLYIRISKVAFTNATYEYSYDNITWNILNTEPFADEEDMILYFKLANQSAETIGSSVKIKSLNINCETQVIKNYNGINFHKIDGSNLRSNDLSASIVNITRKNKLGVFKQFESIPMKLMNFNNLDNSFAQYWDIVSNSAGATFVPYITTGKNIYSIAYPNTVVSTKLRTKYFFEQGEYILKFLTNKLNIQHTAGLTFARLLYECENGTGFDIKLKSSVTTNQQSFLSESFANFDYSTSVLSGGVNLDATGLSANEIEIKIIVSGTTIKTQYRVPNKSTNWTDVNTFTHNDASLKGFFFIEVDNTSTALNGFTNLIEFRSLNNVKANNQCLVFNPADNPYIDLNTGLCDKLNKYTMHVAFSTFKDITTDRTILMLGDVANTYLEIKKKASNIFSLEFKNHYGNIITINSPAISFATTQDWILSIAFSKSKGLSFYINGILISLLNNGTECALVYDILHSYFGKNNASSNYFYGKFYQIALFYDYQDIAAVSQYYNSESNSLTNKKFITGASI